jgi:cytoskeletal protein CcmA (bactofilin family)
VRRSMVVGLFILLVLGLAAPAWAQDSQATEAFVVLSGRADVPQGQTVGDLVVFHGSSTVDGTVDGSLTAFDAPVTISGRVNGDVVVFNGRVALRSGANVTGDVVSQSDPVVASGATIGGTTKRLETNTNWEGFGWAGKLAWWLAVSISTLVVGLVLVWLTGRGANRILEAGRTRIGPSIGLGLFFGLPLLAIIALVTVVGIPLGLGLGAALLLIFALGYSATAWILGRSIVREPTAWAVAFLAGWAILRVVALIPILGGLVWFVAVAFGLGALAVASGEPGPRAAPLPQPPDRPTTSCGPLASPTRPPGGLAGEVGVSLVVAERP